MPYSVHQQSWPEFRPSLATGRRVEIVVQVNGKVRDKIMIARRCESRGGNDCRAGERAGHGVHVAGREPSRIIYVPGRLLNIIVK